MLASESFPLDIPVDLMPENLLIPLSSALSDDGVMSPWPALVHTYSRQKLTKREDKLVAIAALAREYAPHQKSRYLAGIWESELPVALLWYTHQCDDWSTSYRAPSWSWASLDGSLGTYPDARDPGYHALTHKVSVDTELDGPDEYGPVRGGCLVVRGYRIPIRLPLTSEGKLRKWRALDSLSSESSDDECWIEFDRDCGHRDSHDLPEVLYVLPLVIYRHSSRQFSFEGLILQLVEREEDVYKRVGAIFESLSLKGCDEDADRPVEFKNQDVYACLRVEGHSESDEPGTVDYPVDEARLKYFKVI